MTTNKELVEKFTVGERSGHSGTMHIESFCAKENGLVRTLLYSYATPIAMRGFAPCGDLFYIIVNKKFSQTTARHLALLKENTVFIESFVRRLVQPDKFKEYLENQHISTGRL